MVVSGRIGVSRPHLYGFEWVEPSKNELGWVEPSKNELVSILRTVETDRRNRGSAYSDVMIPNTNASTAVEAMIATAITAQ